MTRIVPVNTLLIVSSLAFIARPLGTVLDSFEQGELFSSSCMSSIFIPCSTFLLCSQQATDRLLSQVHLHEVLTSQQLLITTQKSCTRLCMNARPGCKPRKNALLDTENYEEATGAGVDQHVCYTDSTFDS